MKWCPISRRHFLQGAGGTVLALPLLPSLLSRQARAQLLATSPQKTFIGIAGNAGMIDWIGPNSILMPRLPLNLMNDARTDTNPLVANLLTYRKDASTANQRVYRGTLTSLLQGGQISQIIDSSFNSLLPKMNMMQGFDYVPLAAYHHNAHFGNMWDTAGSDTNMMTPMASIDHVMAYSQNFYKNPALRGRTVAWSANDLENRLGGSGGYGGPSATYVDPSNPLTGGIVGATIWTNPVALWDKFFGTNMGTTPVKKTLVDAVLADYKALRNHSRLGSADRNSLDQHIALLQNTQQQLATTISALQPCPRPPANAPSGTYWGAGLYPRNGISCTYEDRVLLLHTMNSVIASIIASGLCHSFLGSASSIISVDPGKFHEWSHAGRANDENNGEGAIADPAQYELLVRQNTHTLRDIFLDLARKLDAIKPDGVNSLLDNSLIAYVQEHSRRGHESFNTPIITAGSAAGVIKTGQYIDFRRFENIYRDDKVFTRFGFPINQVWANWLRAMDVPPTEFEKLNPPANAHSYFTINGRHTGYGCTGNGNFLHDLLTGMYRADYDPANWNGRDLSAWLPFLTPTS
jgi:hypothetical protein